MLEETLWCKHELRPLGLGTRRTLDVATWMLGIGVLLVLCYNCSQECKQRVAQQS